MNRAFYSLPDPREVGLKWKQYEQARAKVERIEERQREAGEAEANLNKRIRELEDVGVRSLAEAILKGSADPSAPTEQLEELGAKLREQRRVRDALSQALPKAEEELRQVVYEHQHRWKEEADSALERAIQEERKAYDKALQLIQEPRRRRIYAELLAAWVRYPQPTFGEPSDVAALSAMQNLQAGAYSAEQKLEERRQAELEQLQEQEAVS